MAMAVPSYGYGYGYDNGYGYGYGYAHVCGRSMAAFMYDGVGLAGARVVA